MSLTSYRAAPPRGVVVMRLSGLRFRALGWCGVGGVGSCQYGGPEVWPASDEHRVGWVGCCGARQRSDLGLAGGCGWGLREPGGDLLFRVLRRSTIGAEGFHGRVRDGIGCLAPRCGHQAVAAPLLNTKNAREKPTADGTTEDGGETSPRAVIGRGAAMSPVCGCPGWLSWDRCLACRLLGLSAVARRNL